MYLYPDLNRRPSTFDGYRTAIVDTLGPTAQHVAHNADLHRLLSSFHRDRPKNLPKWNLSVVLNELTTAPFEPMKDTDLKHLTLKTAFLLKPTQERWLKLQDLILQLKSKCVLTTRCLMSLIGLLASTEKMVPEGRLHMRPFQFHLKEHWRYPQSLDNLLPWTEAIAAHLDWWHKRDERCRPSSQRPQYPTLY